MWFQSLFSRPARARQGEERQASPQGRPSAPPASSSSAARSAMHEILRLALRDSLLRNGIPPKWISAEGLRSQDASGAQSLHVRLRIHHWDVRLLGCLDALQAEFLRRTQLLDGARVLKLQGVSWMFDLPDASACPPLPHYTAWTAARAEQPPAAVRPARGRMFTPTVPGDLPPRPPA